MKFLVPAADAQSGVGAGSKEQGAIHNGMWAMTLSPWRPISQLNCACRINLQCGSVSLGAACSVACLEWDMVDNRFQVWMLMGPTAIILLLFETYAAKEAKARCDC
ncbi:hypothetical protein [Geosporobacter ferrireducens]|uniref:Uncharacterized protein n=2 Tax=Geosporobacter ferrireducens TaxID=1424294 RepID=A0A1D8GB56_9FIRM|nr:hypothetical protein [Geosporobacter ferrireducens]AOT68147.1 hypothetical protein Gferi_00255 [Geosporobacter ferrireducens]